MDPRCVRTRALVAALLAATLLAACGDTTPSAPGSTLTLTFTTPVQARFVPCTTCTDGPTTRVVAEFPVTVADPQGPGGQVERVEVLVLNRTRGVELGRNSRPNKDFPYTNTLVPAGGSLTLEAGIVFDPPPPRDDIELTVTVVLGDGRLGRRTTAISIATPEGRSEPSSDPSCEPWPPTSRPGQDANAARCAAARDRAARTA